MPRVMTPESRRQSSYHLQTLTDMPMINGKGSEVIMSPLCGSDVLSPPPGSTSRRSCVWERVAVPSIASDICPQ